MAKETFSYVCLYEERNSNFGFSIKNSNDFPDKISKDATEIGKSEKRFRMKNSDKDSMFAARFSDFTESMMGYVDILPLIASLGNMFSSHMGKQVLEKFLKESSKSLELRDGSTVYKIPNSRISELLKIRDDLKSANKASKEVPRMLLIGIVSSYEHHLALTARAIIETNTNILLKKEKMISYKQVLDGKTLDELRSLILDQEVDDIFRESPEKQIGWFEKAISMENISVNFKNWGALMEIFERRNLFAHNNGIVNSQYIGNGQKHKFPNIKTKKIGDEMSVGPKYFKSSLSLVIEFGVELIQFCWRKSVPEETDMADEMLTAFGYDLIVRGQYELATDLLTFAKSIRGNRADYRRRIIIVNLANSLALQGKIESANKILDEEDWSAVSDNFSCCVSAIKKDIEKVVASMRKIGKNGEITLNDYQEWPVFFHVRGKKEFKDEVEKIFKQVYVPSPEKRGGIVGTFERLRISADSEHNKTNNQTEEKKLH